MAKLKAPLLSLGASGAIGKSIVYFPWKGLDVAREYVVPANPKTTAQKTIRARLTACVALIHYAMGLAADPLAATDTAAYALWGSLQATPRTWFNTICKMWFDMKKVAGKIPIIYRDGTLTPAATSITFHLLWNTDSSDISDGTVNWGTSKSALINSQAVTAGNLIAGIAITGMVANTKYYLQFRPTLPVGFIGGNSGIYHATTTA